MSAVEALSILVGSDLHNSLPGLEWFCRLAEARRPDLIIFLGDFVNRQPLSFVRETLLALRSLAPACFVIPGNWDPREALIEFDIAAHDGLRNLHRASAWLGGLSFAGLGGSTTTPVGNTPMESAEDGFADPLRPLLPADVWVLHNPVHGYRDLTSGGVHAGSPALAKLLDEQQPRPRLVLSGHIHEAVGWEEARGTLFANPGALASSSAAGIRLDATAVNIELLGGTHV